MKNNTFLPATFKINNVLLTLFTVTLLSACASTPPPTGQMATSKDAVKNANLAGSNEFAPLKFKSALEKMSNAEDAMKNKNYVIARQMAEQAQVDAELAIAITNASKAQLAASAIHENNRVLRQEIDRKAK